MLALRGLVGGFLVTFIEREGRCQGTNMERVPALLAAAGEARLTVAGGVTSAAEIAELDRLGADAQVGMALYDGRLPLAEAFCAPLSSDRPDGLWPTVVVDPSRRLLGLVYSNLESLRASLAEQRGVYWSRQRGLWRKGESSGATQRLLRIEPDCDRDSLCFVVEQQGAGFCHRQTSNCFGSGQTRGLAALEERITQLARGPRISGSYTQKVLDEPGWLEAKLIEEARELGLAADPAAVTNEAADLLYFAQCALGRAGVSLAQVEAELDRRALRVSRRVGLPKELIGQSNNPQRSDG
jgi:phosphoribosyl-ATP pyrophosphohydrolase